MALDTDEGADEKSAPSFYFQSWIEEAKEIAKITGRVNLQTSVDENIPGVKLIKKRARRTCLYAATTPITKRPIYDYCTGEKDYMGNVKVRMGLKSIEDLSDFIPDIDIEGIENAPKYIAKRLSREIPEFLEEMPTKKEGVVQCGEINKWSKKIKKKQIMDSPVLDEAQMRKENREKIWNRIQDMPTEGKCYVSEIGIEHTQRIVVQIPTWTEKLREKIKLLREHMIAKQEERHQLNRVAQESLLEAQDTIKELENYMSRDNPMNYREEIAQKLNELKGKIKIAPMHVPDYDLSSDLSEIINRANLAQKMTRVVSTPAGPKSQLGLKQTFIKAANASKIPCRQLKSIKNTAETVLGKPAGETGLLKKDLKYARQVVNRWESGDCTPQKRGD